MPLHSPDRNQPLGRCRGRQKRDPVPNCEPRGVLGDIHLQPDEVVCHEQRRETNYALRKELLRGPHRKKPRFRHARLNLERVGFPAKHMSLNGPVVLALERGCCGSCLANRGRIIRTEIERDLHLQTIDPDGSELPAGPEPRKELGNFLILVREQRLDRRCTGGRTSSGRKQSRERRPGIGNTGPLLTGEPECCEDRDGTPLQPKSDELPEVVLFDPAQVHRLGIRYERIAVPNPFEVLAHMFDVRALHRLRLIRETAHPRPVEPTPQVSRTPCREPCRRVCCVDLHAAPRLSSMRSDFPGLRLIDRTAPFSDRTALLAPEGVFTYEDLDRASANAATGLLAGRDDLAGARVCYLVPPGWEYTAVQWGVWRAGGFGVPLATSHPETELAWVLDDAEPEAIIAHPSLADRVRSLSSRRNIPLLLTPVLLRDGAIAQLPTVPESRAALMLYTSGTTGRPKGVVLTHANLRAQVEALSEAWGWTPDDHILLHLPLHHVHGIVNVLTSALWHGATCEVLPRFRAVDVWERLARCEVSLYMAVPTVYRRLIDAWEAADPSTREAWSDGARACRLMVSGSAALPVPTLERWEAITGHRLLERYGMTEIGMGLSNPLEGERRPGFVGTPLPRVEARLVDDDEIPVPEGQAGSIQIRGPAVFREYWRRPEETDRAFSVGGWFRTGDQAVVEGGSWRILGRNSVDILKTGGEKISALEIEDTLRSHPAVADCAVVGIPDVDWGDRVCAAVVLRTDEVVSGDELRSFTKSRLAPYKVPKDVLLLDDLPRNAMGKVTKPAVRELFIPESHE